MSTSFNNYYKQKSIFKIYLINDINDLYIKLHALFIRLHTETYASLTLFSDAHILICLSSTLNSQLWYLIQHY